MLEVTIAALAMQDAPQPPVPPCEVAAHSMDAIVSELESEAGPACVEQPSLFEMSLEELEQNLSQFHPISGLALAARLFEDESRREDAVRVFYVGQLRYRAYLRCFPDLEPSGEPALFGAIFSSLGPVLNQWASNDPDRWAAIVEEAIDWDAANPQKYISNTACAAAHAEMKEGLTELAANIRENKDDILRRRQEADIDSTAEEE